MENITIKKQHDLTALGKDKSIFYFTIDIEPYSKSNHLFFGNKRTYQPAKFAKNDKLVAAKCKEAMETLGVKKYSGPLLLQIDGYFKTRRVFDACNLSKSLADCLNDVLYYDDRQIIICICTKTYDKVNPRIEIFVKEYDGSHDLVNVANLIKKEKEGVQKSPIKKAKKVSTKPKVKRVTRKKRVVKKNGTKQLSTKQKKK